MVPVALPLAAGDSPLGGDVLEPLGGAAAMLAIIGMALLLPLYVAQRREIARLLEWRERNPEAGDDGRPDELSAATSGFAVPRGDGAMTPAERVTSERPALARIGTAGHGALGLERPPLWRRALERGPRHPLVISLVAVLVAGAIIVGAVSLIRAGKGDAPEGKGIDPSSISVVVLNASPFPGLAGNVAEDVTEAKFVVTGTPAATESTRESTVRYADGSKKEAAAVARRLEIRRVEPFDSEAEAAADGATVVVVVGEDLAQGTGKLEGSGGAS